MPDWQFEQLLKRRNEIVSKSFAFAYSDSRLISRAPIHAFTQSGRPSTSATGYGPLARPRRRPTGGACLHTFIHAARGAVTNRLPGSQRFPHSQRERESQPNTECCGAQVGAKLRGKVRLRPVSVHLFCKTSVLEIQGTRKPRFGWSLHLGFRSPYQKLIKIPDGSLSCRVIRIASDQEADRE